METRARSILIQNYHPTGTQALIRDFKRLGFTVYAPDSDWGRIKYYGPNEGLGGELVSYEAFMATPPGYCLITCKAQEEDLKAIARSHGDKLILNIAQQHHVYEPGIADIMICPDITTFDTYPSPVRHKLFYCPRPHLSAEPIKNIEQSFSGKLACSFISMPGWWPRGTAALTEFKDKYPGPCRMYGHEAADGSLSHAACNEMMASSFFTVHFKEEEAYGLSCLESMMLGTPVVSLRSFMAEKTLGRFFLSPDTAVLADSIDEAVERLCSMTLEEYASMSGAARERVLALTADERTVDLLADALEQA